MVKEAKIIRIGNSKGIRLPKKVILKYRFGERIRLVERPDGILIQAIEADKLSWEETYKAMALEAAEEQEEWSDWQELDIGGENHL